jgi:hypothetical protein
VPANVPGVEADEDHRDDPSADQQVRRQECRADGQPVADEEVAQVVRQDTGVDSERRVGRAACPEGEDADTGHEHREGREHERRAQDGADADLVGAFARREDDRDDRNQGLWQRRPDRGEHGTDRALAESELAAHPFDAVGEELRREQDHDEADEQDQDVRHRGRHAEWGIMASRMAYPAFRG